MNPVQFEQLKEMAGILARSGSFGKHTMESAFATMCRGLSLGVAPVVAMAEMHLIEGKVELSADFMAALVMRSGLCEEWTFVESTHERCVFRAKRKGAQAVTVTWDTARAQKAELVSRGNWRKHPDAMLRARAISEAARMAFPDVLAGIYVQGEIGQEPEEDALVSGQAGQAVHALPGQMPLGLPEQSQGVPGVFEQAPERVPERVPASAPARVQAQVTSSVQTQAAPSRLLARITPSTSGRELIGLARDVAADPGAWSAYAEEWARRAGSYDLVTLQQVRSLLIAGLPEEVRAHDAFVSMEETFQERMAVLSESSGSDSVEQETP